MEGTAPSFVTLQSSNVKTTESKQTPYQTTTAYGEPTYGGATRSYGAFATGGSYALPAGSEVYTSSTFGGAPTREAAASYETEYAAVARGDAAHAAESGYHTTTTVSETVRQVARQAKESGSSVASHLVVGGGGSGAAAAAYATSYAHGSSSPVVKREYGEKRLISVTERTDDSRAHVLSERVTKHEVRIPKRIVREEIIEKIIVVPEKRIVEEVVECPHVYSEKIVEMARPVIIEKVVEVPEIEYVDKVVVEEVEEIREVVVEKTVGESQIIYVDEPKPVPRERVVKVPEVVYRDVVQEKIVEVPREEQVIVSVPKIERVPRKVPVTRYRDVEVPKLVSRKLPIPVSVDAEYEYKLPQLRPVYTKQSFPIYIPRFIEVPVPQEMLSPAMTAATEAHLRKIAHFPNTGGSLCEIETLAAEIMKSNVQKELCSSNAEEAIQKAWHNGTLRLDVPSPVRA